MEKEQSLCKEKKRVELHEPKHYKVILHNDDFTTMDFVVKVLKIVFFKSQEEAEALMLKVHQRLFLRRSTIQSAEGHSDGT